MHPPPSPHLQAREAGDDQKALGQVGAGLEEGVEQRGHCQQLRLQGLKQEWLQPMLPMAIISQVNRNLLYSVCAMLPSIVLFVTCHSLQICYIVIADLCSCSISWEQMDRILPNFVCSLIFTRSRLGLVPVIFPKLVTDLWPLIGVRFLFPLKFLRENWQNFTKLYMHLYWQDLSWDCDLLFFTNLKQSYGHWLMGFTAWKGLQGGL